MFWRLLCYQTLPIIHISRHNRHDHHRACSRNFRRLSLLLVPFKSKAQERREGTVRDRGSAKPTQRWRSPERRRAPISRRALPVSGRESERPLILTTPECDELSVIIWQNCQRNGIHAGRIVFHGAAAAPSGTNRTPTGVCPSL